MDDRRFDSLTKAFATCTSRRSVFKGLLGLSGATVIGGAITESQAGAARRPPPTPRPTTCPGVQTPQGGVCKCPPGLDNCGPACCNTSAPQSVPEHSECCDNECCFGHCYGEELCCPWPDVFCAVNNECCTPDKHQCCGADGCCDHECCPVAGGSGACCEGSNSKCCNGDACIPESGCCSDSECSGCQSCIDHICQDDPSQCDGCLDCSNGTCVKNDQHCDDGDPCTRSSCNDDGSCTPTVRDCRIQNCGCVARDACHPATCDQNTGACNEDFDCAPPGCCTPSDMCFQSICDTDVNLCRETLYCSNDELTEAEADSCCDNFGNPDPACLYVSGAACTTVCPSGLGFVQVDNGCCFKVFCDCCTKYDELGYVDFGDCLASCEFSPD